MMPEVPYLATFSLLLTASAAQVSPFALSISKLLCPLLPEYRVPGLLSKTV